MGDGRWSSSAWSDYASKSTTGKTQREIFKSRQMRDDQNPALIEFRESRDGPDNPNSTPIIIASDVTGSMGMIAEKLMREGINTLATEIYARKPVSDPHIMIMGVGDAETDTAPLQVTQFEADIRVAKQAKDIWLEGRGGANQGESYSIAHLFAATKVRADAIEKRGRKGYLFTVGDEPNLNGMTKAQIEKFLGINVQSDLTAQQIMDMVEREWEVFHIALINEGFCKYNRDKALKSWKAILPERTIELEDFNALAETVVSLIQVTEGANADVVSSSWGGSTAVAVANAIGGVPARSGQSTGVRRL